MIDDQKIARLAHILFDGNPIKLHKSLWRASGGNKARAFEISTAYIKSYHMTMDEQEFDIVCSLMNDNVEVEWDS